MLLKNNTIHHTYSAFQNDILLLFQVIISSKMCHIKMHYYFYFYFSVSNILRCFISVLSESFKTLILKVDSKTPVIVGMCLLFYVRCFRIFDYIMLYIESFVVQIFQILLKYEAEIYVGLINQKICINVFKIKSYTLDTLESLDS